MSEKLTRHLKKQAALYVCDALRLDEKTMFLSRLADDPALQAYVQELKNTLAGTETLRRIKPSEQYLANQRTLLQGRIEQLTVSDRKYHLLSHLRGVWSHFLSLLFDTRQPVWAVATYVIMAFAIGRWAFTPLPVDNNTQPDLQEILKQGTIQNARLYLTGNSAQPLQVMLETTENMVFSGDLTDNRLQELVQYLVLNDKNVGNRLKAVDLLQDSPTPPEKAQLVLISSMLTDVNSGVRLKAARALQKFDSPSPTLLQACQKVLLEEENDAVRQEAITILSRFPDASLVPTLRVVSAMDENVYIRNQAKEILSALDSGLTNDAIEVNP